MLNKAIPILNLFMNFLKQIVCEILNDFLMEFTVLTFLVKWIIFPAVFVYTWYLFTEFYILAKEKLLLRKNLEPKGVLKV